MDFLGLDFGGLVGCDFAVSHGRDRKSIPIWGGRCQRQLVTAGSGSSFSCGGRPIDTTILSFRLMGAGGLIRRMGRGGWCGAVTSRSGTEGVSGWPAIYDGVRDEGVEAEFWDSAGALGESWNGGESDWEGMLMTGREDSLEWKRGLECRKWR